MKVSTLLATFLAGSSLTAAVPEPDVVFYGRVTRSPLNTAYVLAGVTWSLSGNAEMLAVSQSTVVTVNGETFYLSRIPVETRRLAYHTPLPATPNTLSVPAAATLYMRHATVDGQSAELVNPMDATFMFGPADIGMLQRVDLRLSNLPEVDSDGDGMSDAAEFLAGTDPRDPTSVLKAYSDLRPELVGGEFSGIVIEWQSVPGKRYSVDRATALAAGFQAIQLSVIATDERTRFRDDSAVGSGPFFYRIRVE